MISKTLHSHIVWIKCSFSRYTIILYVIRFDLLAFCWEFLLLHSRMILICFFFPLLLWYISCYGCRVQLTFHLCYVVFQHRDFHRLSVMIFIFSKSVIVIFPFPYMILVIWVLSFFCSIHINILLFIYNTYLYWLNLFFNNFIQVHNVLYLFSFPIVSYFPHLSSTPLPYKFLSQIHGFFLSSKSIIVTFHFACAILPIWDLSLFLGQSMLIIKK